MAALVQTVGPCEPWSTSYDHKAVSMRIDLDKVTYGTSFWKFNNSFLEDLGFLQKVDDQIAWLVYTNQKAKPDGQSLSLRDISLLTKRERSNVELTAVQTISATGEIPTEVKNWLVNTFCQTNIRKKIGN